MIRLDTEIYSYKTKIDYNEFKIYSEKEELHIVHGAKHHKQINSYNKKIRKDRVDNDDERIYSELGMG